MNTNEILAAFDEQGITVNEVVTSLAAHEKVVAEYSVRCAQTVLVAAVVDSKRKSKADLARETGASAMQVGRYYAAGTILIAHADLDPEAVMAYANTHSQADCKRVAKMSEEDAQEEITPKKERSQKTEAEKDLAAIEALMKRIRKAGEAGDIDRVQALDSALTMLTDALPEAYAAAESGAVEEVA